MGRPKGKEPPKANVASRVSQELYDWFDARSKAEQRTVSQLVSFAMEEYRERQENGAAVAPVLMAELESAASAYGCTLNDYVALVLASGHPKKPTPLMVAAKKKGGR